MGDGRLPAAYEVRPLTPETWPAFAALAEAHGGVWDGCWCVGFHEEGAIRSRERRAWKQARVDAGTTHNALVLLDDECVGWCQYGPTPELPRIKHRKAYAAGLDALPDWRITCFFTGRGHRRRGVSDVALDGALRLVAEAGGGVVESYPEDTAGRTVSGSFLHNGSLALFERHGFARDRRIGKHRWVVRREV